MSLPPNRAIDALNLPLDERILPAESTVSGMARVGLRVVDHVGDADIGLWEISPSISTDVEVDEVFVVLSGEATVHIAGSDSLELRPGSLVRLAAGSSTTWDVRQTLRKLYIA